MLVCLYDLLTALETIGKSIFKGEQEPQNAGRFFGGHLWSAWDRTDNVALKVRHSHGQSGSGSMLNNPG